MMYSTVKQDLHTTIIHVERESVDQDRRPNLQADNSVSLLPDDLSRPTCICCSTCELTTPPEGPEPEAVIEASRSGDLHSMRHALCQLRGKIIACADEDGMTALHVASQKGHLPIVKLLLSASAPQDVGTRVTDSEKGLEVVRDNSRLPRRRDVMKLQSAGDSDSYPTTPSQPPMTTEDSEKWTVSSTTGSSVASSGQKSNSGMNTTVKAVSGILDEPSQIFQISNPPSEASSDPMDTTSPKSVWASQRTTRGHTALHWAAIKGHFACVAELLSFGFDVDAKSNQKATPLHLAVAAEKLDVVKLLVSAGADVNSTTTSGSSPMAAARHRGNISIVEVLSSSSGIDNFHSM
eukprot:Lankesteria_metandrocarpae@DN4879_c0_g1_i2.p1